MTEVGLVVLVIGTAIMAVEFGCIAGGAWRVMCQVYPDPVQARRVAAVVVAPAVLLGAGALMLVSTVGIGPDAGIRTVLARTGLVFLLTALVHAMAMAILISEKHEVEHIEDVERSWMRLPHGRLRPLSRPSDRIPPGGHTVSRRPLAWRRWLPGGNNGGVRAG